jgi:hypothetical protein
MLFIEQLGWLEEMALVVRKQRCTDVDGEPEVSRRALHELVD